MDPILKCVSLTLIPDHEYYFFFRGNSMEIS